MPAPHKGAAIVDPHDYASAVANPNERAKRQCAMSRGHCRTVETLTVGGATAAQTITTAIDACKLGTRELTAAKQQRGPQKQFHIAREHIPTPRFFEPSKREGFNGIPKPSQSSEIGLQLTAKFRQRSASEINDYGKGYFLCRLPNKNTSFASHPTNKLSPRAEFHWNLVGSARRCAHLTVDFSAFHANELRDVAQAPRRR